MINVFSNYASCDTRQEAQTIVDIIAEETGYVQNVFKDDGMYRVHFNSIGEYRVQELLEIYKGCNNVQGIVPSPA